MFQALFRELYQFIIRVFFAGEGEAWYQKLQYLRPGARYHYLPAKAIEALTYS